MQQPWKDNYAVAFPPIKWAYVWDYLAAKPLSSVSSCLVSLGDAQGDGNAILVGGFD